MAGGNSGPPLMNSMCQLPSMGTGAPAGSSQVQPEPDAAPRDVVAVQGIEQVDHIILDHLLGGPLAGEEFER